MKVSILASGSNGNCAVVVNGDESIIIDTGISHRMFVKRSNLVGYNPLTAKAILLTHDHKDHIEHLNKFGKMLGIPVITTQEIFDKNPKHFKGVEFVELTRFIEIAGMDIESFPVSHDGTTNHGFNFHSNAKKISFILDTGKFDFYSRIYNSDILVIESNHDPVWLQEKSSMPEHRKVRVKSELGHLSNSQTIEAIRDIASTEDCKLKHIVLAHLSGEANTPEMAKEGVVDLLDELGLQNITVNVASRLNAIDFEEV